MIVKIVEGDILNAKEEYIAHQCNCVTKNGKGLSKAIFSKYPFSDVYSNRTEYSVPGTVLISSDDNEFHKIISLFAQYVCGKPYYKKYYPKKYDDTYENRLLWFEKCLYRLHEQGIKTIAVPYGIGCGLAGGKWENYKKILERAKVNIVLYKLPRK